MTFRPNLAQVIAGMMAVLYSAFAFRAWDPADSAGGVVLAMWAVIAGFVVIWARTSPVESKIGVSQERLGMWMAQLQYGPEELAFGFGDSASAAAEALVAACPYASGRELVVCKIISGQGYDSIEALECQTIVVGARTAHPLRPDK